MDFKLLDDVLESTLKKILDASFNGVIDEFFLPTYYNQSEIDGLVDNGCLSVVRLHSNKRYSSYSITHNGKHYFENKEKFLMQKRKAERKESRRYWITTSIAIFALIIAIIALFV